MAESKAQKFSSNYYTFLTKRFDRTDNGKRIHFTSAMTTLGYKDGQDYSDGGWVLSPAYDINPTETGTGLKLNISDEDNSLNLDLAINVCEYFRLSNKRAVEIMNEIKSSVRNWKKIAAKYGISRREQELKSLVFRLAEM